MPNSSEVDMFNNAEFLRNVRVQLTPRRLAFTCGLTIGLILISELLVWSGTAPTRYSPSDYDRVLEFGKVSFNLLFFAQVILLVAMAPSMLGGNMVQERLRNTLIFQQMTLLSPHEVLLGKMFGSTAVCYILAALLMPFAVVSGLVARISLDSLIGVYLVLFLGSLSWQAVSLFFSTSTINANENVGRNLAGLSYSIGGLAVFFMIIFFNVFWRRNWEFQQDTTYFFGMPIFTLTFALLVMAFVGFWAYVGAVRAFKDMQLVRLSPRTIWYFFITLEVLLVGWFWAGKIIWQENISNYQAYYSESISALILMYLVVNWVFLTGLAGISVISRNQLQEWWSGGDDAVSVLKRNEIKNSIFNYPIAIAITLAGAIVLWLSISLRFSSASLTYNFSVISLLAVIAAFAISMVSAASFIQFCAMFRFKVANRTGVVLWVLLLVLAGIASGIFGPDSIAGVFNPLVFTGVLIDNKGGSSTSLIAYGLLIEILFALISIGVMYWKWRQTREEMLRDKA